MTFKEFMKLKCPEIQPMTDEWLKYSQIWQAAEREDYVDNMETYVNLVQATYQSKRDKLKKQTTHMTGKFMIVKAENNKLRSINKAIIKRNKELQEIVVKHEIQKYVKVIAEETNMKLIPRERPTTYRTPIKC